MSPKHLILGGLLLIAAALSLTAYNLWEDHQASMAARQALAVIETVQAEEPEEDVSENPEPPVPEYVLHPEMEMPTVEIDGVDYIGTLTIPVLELELPIASRSLPVYWFGLFGQPDYRGPQLPGALWFPEPTDLGRYGSAYRRGGQRIFLCGIKNRGASRFRPEGNGGRGVGLDFIYLYHESD